MGSPTLIDPYDKRQPLVDPYETPVTPPSNPAMTPRDGQRAANALIYSRMLDTSPGFAYQRQESIEDAIEERGWDVGEKAWKGLSQDSIIGELLHGRVSGPLESDDEVDQLVEGFGQMVGDLPVYLVGAAGGAAGGAWAGSEVPVIGNVAGAAIGAQAGGFALNQGLRQWLVEKYAKGKVDSFDEVMDIVKASAKGALTGAAVGATGEYLPIPGFLTGGMAGKLEAPMLYRGLAETAAMTTVGDLLEGKVPSLHDFAQNAALLTAMHIGLGALDSAGIGLPAIRDRMMRMYERDGAHPAEIVSEAAKRGEMAAPMEILNRIENTISQAGEEEPTEAPEQPKEEVTGLRPAVTLEGGEVLEGEEGDHHDDVLDKEGIPRDEGQRGFVTPDGAVLSRAQADEWVQHNEPEIYQELKAEGVGRQLDTEEYNEAKQRVTSIKNAQTAAERAQRGLSEVEVEARRSFGQAFDAGKDAVDTGKIDPRQLAEDLAERPRALRAEESAALLYDRMRLQNEHASVMAGIEDARSQGDVPRETRERERLNSIEEAINTNDEASRRTGYEQGLGLAARKMMLQQDYSLARTLQRARVASKTGEISPELRTRLEDLTSQLDEANKRIDAYQETAKQRAAEEEVNRLKRQEARQERAGRRTAKREDIDAEYKDLISQMNKELQTLYANPMLNPKLYELFGKLALNRVRAGIVTIEGIVDDIHAQIQDSGISKREVRDYISQYGRTAELSKDQMKAQLREARRQGRLISALEDAQAKEVPLKSGLQRDKMSPRVKELTRQVKEAMRESGLSKGTERTWETALASYKTRVKGRIRDLEKQLQSGDFTKRGVRRTVLDQEAENLRTQAEKLKQQVDDEIQKRKMEAASGIEKGARLFQKWRRGILLSSVNILEKLTNSAMSRFGVTPIEELLGGVLSEIPGISRIAERAPREGGFSSRAEVRAFLQFFMKATYSDIRETAKTGKSSLDYLYGKKGSLPPEALDFFGHIHGAANVLPKRAEFFRSLEKNAQWALNNHLDIADPKVQVTMAANAYIDANRAVFMQENFVNTGFRMLMNYFHNHGLSGRATEFMIQTVLPIVKVPTNIVGETSEYTLGLVTGGLRALKLVIDEDAMKNLTPHQADNIMRSLKKGSLGLALLAIGYYAGGQGNQTVQAGGFYQPGDRKKDVGPEGLVIGGVKMPDWVQDTPVGLTFQLGATIRRVNDAYTMKGRSGGLVAGAVSGSLSVARKVPFLEEAARLGEASRTADSAGLFIDDLIQSLIIPPDLRRIAQATDKSGAQRKPSNLEETIESNIPGLRENVPMKGRQRRYAIR